MAQKKLSLVPSLEVALLKKFLEEKVRGQPKAINAVCKIYEYDLTIRPIEQLPGPVGVLLFLGPSGVGKTELARSLAEFFSDSSNSLIKIDCSTFSQPHMVHSLIGAPHSYVGFDKPPVLSYEYISRRVKTDNQSPELKSLNSQKEYLRSSIASLRANITGIIEEYQERMSWIRFLDSYKKMLFGSPGNKRMSLAEILKADDGQIILERLPGKTLKACEEDLADPLMCDALIFEMWAEARELFTLYKRCQIELDGLKIDLYEVNEKLAAVRKEEKEQEKTFHAGPKIVLLFDEIEKANPTLHNLLLSIMEDGTVTLADGKVTDLRNAFIIMTSNEGSELMSKAMKGHGMGFSVGPSVKSGGKNEPAFEGIEKRILRIAETALGKRFPAEFRGRIDEVVVFRPLNSTVVLLEILDRQIKEFSASLRKNAKVDLKVEDPVREFIVQQTRHRPEVGARLLAHKFKSIVKIPVGRKLLGEIGSVSSAIVFLDKEGNVSITLIQ